MVKHYTVHLRGTSIEFDHEDVQFIDQLQKLSPNGERNIVVIDISKDRKIAINLGDVTAIELSTPKGPPRAGAF